MRRGPATTPRDRGSPVAPPAPADSPASRWDHRRSSSPSARATRTRRKRGLRSQPPPNRAHVAQHHGREKTFAGQSRRRRNRKPLSAPPPARAVVGLERQTGVFNQLVRG